MLISDWSSDVCSSDLGVHRIVAARHPQPDVVTINGEMDGEAAAVGARLEIAAAYRCCVRKAEAQDLAAREQRRGFWIVGVDDRDPRLVREIAAKAVQPVEALVVSADVCSHRDIGAVKRDSPAPFLSP